MIRQHYKVIRIVGWRQWLYGYWADVRDWFARFIFAQHNARVIIDFEDRMCAVICEATRDRMSKPYYTEEAMLSAIREAFAAEYDDGYQEGRKDLADAHGIDLTRRCRACGCTEERACVNDTGPCSWVAIDLCSHCPTESEAA